MKKYRKLLLFILLFAIFLFWNIAETDLYADEVWNYGFVYSIYHGFIPYTDFNMVITPFYPFLLSFFMFLVGSSNILVIHIVNSFMITMLCVLLDRLIGNKMWLALLFLFVPMPNLFPSYNLFVTFLFVLVIYLEKKKNNDFFLGFIIGLAILTKQSVGFCLLFPSLYYIKDWKKILKRLIGMMIPLIIFVIYLFISKSMMDFLDLCFFGLLDFTENQSSFNIVYIFSVLYLFFCIYYIKKDPKNIYHYYALAAFGMTIPLIDLYHFQLSFFCFLTILLMHHDFKYKLNYPLIFFGIIIGVCVIQLKDRILQGIVYPNNIPHFEYRLLNKDMLYYTDVMNQYRNKHRDREIVFLTNNAYYFRIIWDEKISKIDLINYGNHGYHGNEKLLNLIKEKKDAIFIVDYKELHPKKQTNKEIIHYVMKNAKKVDKIDKYDVYIFTGEYDY